MSQPLCCMLFCLIKMKSKWKDKAFHGHFFCYKALLQELFLKMPGNMSISFRGFFSSCAIQEDSKMP